MKSHVGPGLGTEVGRPKVEISDVVSLKDVLISQQIMWKAGIYLSFHELGLKKFTIHSFLPKLSVKKHVKGHQMIRNEDDNSSGYGDTFLTLFLGHFDHFIGTAGAHNSISIEVAIPPPPFPFE